MRLLLDTHAFLWWLDGDARLSKRARAATSLAPEAFAFFIVASAAATTRLLSDNK